MNMKNDIDTSILNNLIYGRVFPQIYAFKTNTIPNYLKIGDTYRPLETRIKEWRLKYPNLELTLNKNAFVNENVYFRDYSVHKYLMNEGKKRLTIDDLKKINRNLYYSDEFFENTTIQDVEEAIDDIIDNYPSSIYDYYSIHNPSVPQEIKYPRIDTYRPRPNQEETIKNFVNAVKKGRTKLLMYAVMRFGKSITSLWCAKAIDAKVVVIVSGKADVREEWKKTLESHVDFGDPEYIFLTSDKLLRDEHLIEKTLKSGKRVVLFFTLQDFLLKNQVNEGIIKKKHKELFEISNNNLIDLLLIDETHYGARAPEYSKVLDDGTQDIDLLYDVPKTIKSKITMHLSGTPYKILMNSEFGKDDIVAFYQFTDIIDDQRAWDIAPENIDNDEWENPYYGFPEMIRFAFNLNKKSLERIQKLNEDGVSTSLSEIFRTKSIEQDLAQKLHEKFLYEEEVLDFLETIDHKNDEGLLSFLNHEKIKDGKLCQHMVIVLPYRSSCDAMEKLIKKNNNRFFNLREYKILNISGHNQPQKYKNENGVNNIKNDISRFANKNIKTITLTVNRLLTGTTVKEWDTMMYLKGGYSPQEYDQAIFRLQNPWIQDFRDSQGKVIKYNMKPQTLLVDFDPTRMFIMVEEKAKIYNINVEENGNDRLEERIDKELSVSPLIWINANKLHKVIPANIMDAIREYSSERSVVDEAKQIPVDFNILNNPLIRYEIERQSKISTKNKLELKPVEGEGQDFDVPEQKGTSSEEIGSDNDTSENKVDKTSFREKMATYYARILFFAFLTKDEVKSLKNIIDSLRANDDNSRIAFNLDLDQDVLNEIQKYMNPHVLSQLDYKIQNINSLSRDENKSELERAKIAIKNFTVFSDSEVVTPSWIANDLIDIIGVENLRKLFDKGSSVFDISSKSGEFAAAIYEKMTLEGNAVSDFRNKIVSLPTSKFGYEFTRKTYEILGLNTDNIIETFNSYDLLNKIINDSKKAYELIENSNNYLESNIFNDKEGVNMKFDLIIGNPPYQDRGGSGGNNDAAIYQHFVEFAISLKPDYCSMIIPARWFAAGRENLLGNFRRNFLNSSKISDLVVYPNASEIFPNVQIEGGVCYYKYDLKGNYNETNYSYITEKNVKKIKRKLNEFDVLIADPVLGNIVKKVDAKMKETNTASVDSIISADTPFGIASNPKVSKKTPTKVFSKSSPEHNTKLFHIERGKRKVEYVEGSKIKKNAVDINKDKVFITGGYGGHEQVLSVPELAPKNSVCSQSYLYAAFNSKSEAENFIKYLKTKFFRVLVSAMKITQSAPKRVYRFVPIQDFSKSSDIDWSESVSNLDKKLYKIYDLTEEEVMFIENKVSSM